MNGVYGVFTCRNFSNSDCFELQCQFPGTTPVNKVEGVLKVCSFPSDLSKRILNIFSYVITTGLDLVNPVNLTQAIKRGLSDVEATFIEGTHLCSPFSETCVTIVKMNATCLEDEQATAGNFTGFLNSLPVQHPSPSSGPLGAVEIAAITIVSLAALSACVIICRSSYVSKKTVPVDREVKAASMAPSAPPAATPLTV